MSNTYHISPNDERVRRILTAAFPDYQGRKAKLCVFHGPMNVNSYWDGGSRAYFAFVRLADCKPWPVPDSHPCFNRRPNGQTMGRIECTELPAGVVLVCHSIFFGRDMGLTVYANQDDLAPILPAPVELTDAERIVLEYTRSYKATYGGLKNYRFREARLATGITSVDWETAKAALIVRKLLNKAGAITDAGRNAIEGADNGR